MPVSTGGYRGSELPFSFMSFRKKAKTVLILNGALAKDKISHPGLWRQRWRSWDCF